MAMCYPFHGVKTLSKRFLEGMNYQHKDCISNVIISGRLSISLYEHLNLTHGLVHEGKIGMNLCVSTNLWIVVFFSAVFSRIL